ncbi:MAG TPA: hypothetical protein EYN14_14125 [Alphaproteobacteria bacterium]|nr:hypothetical protein [Alphaproteobacteria bacterium]
MDLARCGSCRKPLEDWRGSG